MIKKILKKLFYKSECRITHHSVSEYSGFGCIKLRIFLNITVNQYHLDGIDNLKIFILKKMDQFLDVYLNDIKLVREDIEKMECVPYDLKKE